MLGIALWGAVTAARFKKTHRNINDFKNQAPPKFKRYDSFASATQLVAR
jgi:hypothetical protein